MTNNENIFEDKINEILKDIRPYLQADGGDIELVSISRTMTVKLKLTGACMNCPINEQTLNSIAQSLKAAIPEIKKVVLV